MIKKKCSLLTVISSLRNTGTEIEINYFMLEWRVVICYTYVVMGFCLKTFKEGTGTSSICER